MGTLREWCQSCWHEGERDSGPQDRTEQGSSDHMCVCGGEGWAVRHLLWAPLTRDTVPQHLASLESGLLQSLAQHWSRPHQNIIIIFYFSLSKLEHFLRTLLWTLVTRFSLVCHWHTDVTLLEFMWHTWLLFFVKNKCCYGFSLLLLGGIIYMNSRNRWIEKQYHLAKCFIYSFKIKSLYLLLKNFHQLITMYFPYVCSFSHY